MAGSLEGGLFCTKEVRMTRQEIERLRHVYAAYQTDERIATRWAEDNPGNQTILQERRRVLRGMLQAAGLFPPGGLRILDVGCGSGQVLAGFAEWGASQDNLYGVDLLAERIEVARHRFTDLHFQQANAEALPFKTGFFDLVLLFTVFTSILDATMARNVAGEVQRVLQPGGAVAWYDFRYNNPRNANVRGMAKHRIKELFPGWELRLNTVTLLPFLARRLGRFTPLLYPSLSALPLLRTHYLGLLIKPR